MVEGQIIANISEILPPSILENINFLLRIIQAVGVAIIVYIIFQIISLIMRRREQRLYRDMNKNLEEIKKLLKNKK